MDELAWAKYKQAKQKQVAREHILSVTHSKAQLAIGKGMLSHQFCHIMLFYFILQAFDVD